jgi:putative glutamine amidotransferase
MVDMDHRGPLIGITTYDDTAEWRGWSAPAALVPRAYVDAVRRAGGRPVLLPPGGSAAEAAATVAGLGGIVIAGGGDVDPARYGAPRQPETGAPCTERDAWELTVLERALAGTVPVLAICRGLQLLNVVRGGTLHQHLPHVVGHEGHSGGPGWFGSHPVRIADTGVAARILGPDRDGAEGPGPAEALGLARDPDGDGGAGREGHWLDVPTHHHQAVDRLGDGLAASAWAEDGTVEAIELAAPAGFLIAVQWHPEEDSDPRLFRALVHAAACREGCA